MDWQDYAQVEQLTDLEPYRDHKIVVCAFKNKSKRLVRVKDKTLNITYLDDICAQLDAEANQANLFKPLAAKPDRLWRRIIDRIKSGEVGLAILRKFKRHITLRNCKIINRLPVNTLCLSEMLIKVLFSQPTNISCDSLLVNAYIDAKQDLYACCSAWQPPFGNLTQADLTAVYDGHRARIIKLSALNHSYCFCNLRLCEKVNYTATPITTLSVLKTAPRPTGSLALGFDKSCNLRCTTCRKDYYTADTVTQKYNQQLLKKLLASGWLSACSCLVLASDGEVWYGTAYKQLLMKDLKRPQVHILSNGTLFTRQNWELIKNKYSQIAVEISVDAATAATYQKIRGGDFQQLLRNLEMLGELRANNEIKYFELNFVVQKENYTEMVAFVALGKSLHADRVHFTRLNNLGAFTLNEYRKKALIVKHQYLTRELYTILQDPIFKEPVVDIVAFQPYLANSAKYYGK